MGVIKELVALAILGGRRQRSGELGSTYCQCVGGAKGVFVEASSCPSGWLLVE